MLWVFSFHTHQNSTNIPRMTSQWLPVCPPICRLLVKYRSKVLKLTGCFTHWRDNGVSEIYSKILNHTQNIFLNFFFFYYHVALNPDSDGLPSTSCKTASTFLSEMIWKTKQNKTENKNKTKTKQKTLFCQKPS